MHGQDDQDVRVPQRQFCDSAADASHRFTPRLSTMRRDEHYATTVGYCFVDRRISD
jgi:hypothetical protein